MRVTIFKNVKATMPQETELDMIVYMMSHSQELCNRTQAYRNDIVSSGKKKDTKKMKITRFPAFAPCAFFYSGKSRNDVIGLTDLCYLDFDHIQVEGQIIEAMNILRNEKNIVLASRSVSSRGLHVLIRYAIKGMEMPPQRVAMTPVRMQKLYARVYARLAKEYSHKLGFDTDIMAGHIEHLYLVTYDPELYYNPNAKPLLIDLAANES